MKTLSTFLIALSLVAGYGCARDDDRGSAPRASRSSGDDGQSASRRSAARTDDVGENADEGQAASASAVGADAQGNAAPIASSDQQGAAPTAQQQPMANNDEDITRQIRQAVVGDGSLSISARNTTIVTRSGVVTLRGSVPDSDERDAIERHARAVTGVSRVDNRVSVRN